MTVQPTFPGVYVQEVPSGVRTIMGVSTSTALFIGRSARGPLNTPVRCGNYTNFVNTFGDDTSASTLPNYLKLFFLNGGTDCYVTRIANGAKQSYVTLLNNDSPTPTSVLKLTAKDPGVAGELIRAAVTYSGAQPEITFNLDIFRWVVDSAGNRTKQSAESFKNLSMNPASPLFVQNVITQNSNLVSAQALVTSTTAKGFSLSGRLVSIPTTGTDPFQSVFAPLLNNKKFQISVGGSPYVDVTVPANTVATGATAVADTQTALKAAIELQFTTLSLPMKVKVEFVNSPTSSTKRLKITADAAGDDVLLRSAATDDMCAPLMMGTANGGIEVGAWAALRPAANGIVFDASNQAALDALAGTQQGDFKGIKLDDGTGTSTTVSFVLVKGSCVATDPISKDSYASPTTNNSDGVREKLEIIASAINSASALKWQAQVWGSRLAIIPTDDLGDNFIGSSTIFGLDMVSGSTSTLASTHFLQNVHNYSLGVSGLPYTTTDKRPKQKPALSGDIGFDGSAPLASDYQAAYDVIDKEVDLFNLMVLPSDVSVTMSDIYPNASVFCQKRRAFLLMDAPPGWSGAQQPTTAVNTLRTGLVKDYSALFYPRLVIDDKGTQVKIGPSGAIAGLCARIDGTRGVFKAPAGTEADLRGILGVEQRFSDTENGWLNPRAVNTIRVFPNGIVNWGARTMDGDDDFGSEYKYIPIRRLALYMEESLYRGLKWVVFEPNDEPLYSQIRLNVGSFMHDLFRQSAFQGSTPKDAYFVKCDKETTTQSDRDKGIVNIWVGFAPLKPAEFVILYLQQMAGQIQV